MIGEMKREALHSLKGKWGLGVGSTIFISYCKLRRFNGCNAYSINSRSYNIYFSIYFNWFN